MQRVPFSVAMEVPLDISPSDLVSQQEAEERARLKAIASKIYSAGNSSQTLSWARLDQLLGMFLSELDQQELNDWQQHCLEGRVAQPTRGQIYAILAELFDLIAW